MTDQKNFMEKITKNEFIPEYEYSDEKTHFVLHPKQSSKSFIKEYPNLRQGAFVMRNRKGVDGDSFE